MMAQAISAYYPDNKAVNIQFALANMKAAAGGAAKG
jgi:hypothetical protein